MLVEPLSIGRGEDDLVIGTLRLQCSDTTVDGLTLHHHTCAAAIGVVVDTAPLIEGVVTQVMQMNLCQSFLLGTSKD